MKFNVQSPLVLFTWAPIAKRNYCHIRNRALLFSRETAPVIPTLLCCLYFSPRLLSIFHHRLLLTNCFHTSHIWGQSTTQQPYHSFAFVFCSFLLYFCTKISVSVFQCFMLLKARSPKQRGFISFVSHSYLLVLFLALSTQQPSIAFAYIPVPFCRLTIMLFARKQCSMYSVRHSLLTSYVTSLSFIHDRHDCTMPFLITYLHYSDWFAPTNGTICLL